MENKWYIRFVACIVTVTLCSCGHQTKKESNKTVSDKVFTLPDIPVVLQSSQERAAYIVTHYWDNFDFSDTALIKKADITEQAFSNYLDLFSHTSKDVVSQSISSMLDKAMAGDSAMFSHMAGLYERYLYEPNSPFRQEEYYIAALQSIIANNLVDEIYKVRPRYQLEMALKNRPRDRASDIELVLKGGGRTRLSKVSAEYTVLFFNNPDCHDCARVKGELSQWSNPKVKIVSIYPDEEIELWEKTEYPRNWINGRIEKASDKNQYDLRAIPTLYLLDSKKRVILKDAQPREIVDFLEGEPVNGSI